MLSSRFSIQHLYLQSHYQAWRKTVPNGLFQSFIPWILYFIIAGSHHLTNEVAALTALLACVIFSFQQLRKKFILDWCTLVYFFLLMMLYLLPIKGWVGEHAGLLSNAVLALIMWATILIKKPFTMAYAKETVPEIFWITPTFKHINYTLSTVWALALSFMVLDGLLRTYKIIPSLMEELIIVVLFISAIAMTRWYPDWYAGFLFKKFSQQKDNTAANPFLQGNFAPIQTELSVDHLPIEGELPKTLEGIYMRNGPNPAFEPISYTYPIDGDGMLHAVYLQNGKASYRNRFVATKGLMAEKKANRALYGGIKRPIPTDPKLVGKDGDPGPVKNGASIHIIRHADRYLALYEEAPAYEVSVQLQTIGEWCPEKANPPFNMNAHTRLDPKTGELFAFTYSLQPPYLRYYHFDRRGNLLHTVPIDKTYPSMMHDFVLTKNYLVFFDCPAVFDLDALAIGGNLLTWRPDVGVKVAIVDRNTHTFFWIESESFFVYHFANGFEQGHQILIDYVRHEQLALGKEIYVKNPPKLYRACIDLKSKTMRHTEWTDHVVEFPRINEAFMSGPNQYIYAPTRLMDSDQNGFNALMKYDLEKQQCSLHDFGKNAEIGEAVFIPNESNLSEDDGHVGFFVYDKVQKSSDFVLLHATDFLDEPIARVKLPQRVPHGLHGSWMPGSW